MEVDMEEEEYVMVEETGTYIGQQSIIYTSNDEMDIVDEADTGMYMEHQYLDELFADDMSMFGVFADNEYDFLLEDFDYDYFDDHTTNNFVADETQVYIFNHPEYEYPVNTQNLSSM